MLARKALAGTAGAPKLYVEDVMSSYLYTGTGATQTITNNIDLSGEGGLVWIKRRNGTSNSHTLIDSGTYTTGNTYLATNLTNALIDTGSTQFSLLSTGFSVTNNVQWNGTTSDTYASWTFRKAKKFFDVVTYTGNGSARTISHNLGSTPGCIIVKRTDTTGDWYVYHRSNTAAPETDYLLLNSTAATADLDTVWNDTAPTSTVFSVGTNSGVNANSGTYVAYLFAHDAGGFGDAGSDSIIKCGSYTGAGSDITVDLGWEPQFLLIKASNTTGDWWLTDTMRGLNMSGSIRLEPNTSDAEAAIYDGVRPTSTGFFLPTGTVLNDSGLTCIYIAIRRGPMKTPTSGTSVFSPNSSSASTGTKITTDFPIDMQIWGLRADGGSSKRLVDRLRGVSSNTTTSGVALFTDLTNAEDSASASTRYFDNTGFTIPDTFVSGLSTIYWSFRRAPGFFDVVCYTGTGSNTTISHNLGVAPELMIIKKRDSAQAWAVYAGDNTDYLVLNTNAATNDLAAYWNDTSPTSSVFTVGTSDAVNASGSPYVAYLFASLTGISKIGTYTGNGSSVTVTTDFQPRFILVKRTDSTGNWIVGDSARGLVAGNDPYLLLNSDVVEDTDEDWVDITSTSFTVNQTTASNANVNTGTYIYLAIA